MFMIFFGMQQKKAGEAKKTEDPAVGEELLGLINEIDEVFQATKS